MTHRVQDTKDAEPQKPLAARMFADKFLPHWAMLAVTLLYIGSVVTMGSAGVPQTISLAFTATLGAWFTYLIRQRANNGG